ncbi:MAG: amidohydrolase family protein [Lapillicoccus sp.]
MYAVRAPHAFDGERFVAGGATVLVEDGVIRGIEPHGYPVPEGTEVLDHPDATLLPGLIDTHTHLIGDGGLGALDRVETYTDAEIDAVMTRALHRQLAAGVTTVRDLGDRGFCAVDRRDRQRADPAAVRLEPRILASGPPITSPRGHCWNMRGEVDGPDGIRAAVAERADRGVDVVKVMASGGMATQGTDVFGAQFSHDDLQLLVDLSHAAGLGLTAHAHSLVAVETALDVRADGIEHCSCLTPEGPRLTPAVVERLATSGTSVCLTLGLDVALMATMTPPPQMRAVMERLGLDAMSFRRSRLEATGTLAAAGVRLLTGVDSGIAPMKPHGFVSRSVADHVEAGMPVASAVAAATSVSTDALGVGALTGRLRAGLAADLLVVAGDLSTDVDALTRVQRVVLRGVPVATLGP